jgi:hypothetical protein
VPIHLVIARAKPVVIHCESGSELHYPIAFPRDTMDCRVVLPSSSQ